MSAERDNEPMQSEGWSDFHLLHYKDGLHLLGL